jgi:hypothetical protein
VLIELIFTAAAWLQRGHFCNETWVLGRPAMFRHEARATETLGNIKAKPLSLFDSGIDPNFP